MKHSYTTKKYLVMVQMKGTESTFYIDLPYIQHSSESPCDAERAELLLAAFKNNAEAVTAAINKDKLNVLPHPLVTMSGLSVDDIIEMRSPPGIRWVVVEVSYLERVFKSE